MSKEHKLQAKMVMNFAQQRPEDRGLLWATLNRTLSMKDGQKQKAMGLIKGVSDLIYFKEDHFVCIEVKYPGEKHDKQHITNQLNWGKKITKEGGYYFIVTSLAGFWSLINGDNKHPDILGVEKIQQKIEESKTTVIF